MGQKSPEKRDFLSSLFIQDADLVFTFLCFSILTYWELLIPSGTFSDLCFDLCEFLRIQSYYLSHTLTALRQICKQKASENSVIT